jgi:hypothetical protein
MGGQPFGEGILGALPSSEDLKQTTFQDGLNRGLFPPKAILPLEQS